MMALMVTKFCTLKPPTLFDSENSDCSTMNVIEADNGSVSDYTIIDEDEDEDGNTENVDKKTFSLFMNRHPYNTHHVNILPENNGYVPNFVGGILPRSNTRDREYNCSTMLSLFKPWRHRRDLKGDDKSWG